LRKKDKNQKINHQQGIKIPTEIVDFFVQPSFHPLVNRYIWGKDIIPNYQEEKMNQTMKLSDFYQIHKGLKDKEVVLDVRNPDEHKEARIKGSLNIPVPELKDHVNTLKNYQKIFIHCKRGGRAKIAFQFLKDQGLENLICIDDAGMDLWKENGYPVES
jgi:rhodanese-related sulfurtransferase